jgi:hypothetical protein
MLDCPKCGHSVESQTVACPVCRTPLKAYGHPGIPLHRATGKEPLCVTCTYHEDDTCTYPQRPLALDCILYHDRSQPLYRPVQAKGQWGSPARLQRQVVWLVLLGLVLVSFLVVLLQ